MGVIVQMLLKICLLNLQVSEAVPGATERQGLPIQREGASVSIFLEPVSCSRSAHIPAAVGPPRSGPVDSPTAGYLTHSEA